jgi:hypothetical protein
MTNNQHFLIEELKQILRYADGDMNPGLCEYMRSSLKRCQQYLNKIELGEGEEYQHKPVKAACKVRGMRHNHRGITANSMIAQ